MSVETLPPAVRLSSVQALRGVAALLVVLFHAAEVWRDLAGTEGFAGPWDRMWFGVDLFFVISGFIMVWVAGTRPAGFRTALRFLYQRAVRIYPLWWVFCLVMAGYFALTYGQPARPDLFGADAAWRHLGTSLLLWPTGSFPILQVGWTLIYEIAFYALFALLLLVPARIRPWALLLWAVVILARWNAPGSETVIADSWFGILLNPVSLEFAFGAAVAFALRSLRIAPALALAVVVGAGAALAAMTLLVTDVAMEASQGRVASFGLAGAALVFGLVALEIQGKLSTPRWLEALGDASYTLYLCHFLVLLALARVCDRLGLFSGPTAFSLAGFMAVGTALSIMAAWVGYRLIETPLLRVSRRPLARLERRVQEKDAGR